MGGLDNPLEIMDCYNTLRFLLTFYLAKTNNDIPIVFNLSI